MTLLILTSRAAEKARAYEKEGKLVRFGLIKGGCSGFMYDISLAPGLKERELAGAKTNGDAKESADDIIEQDGATVLVAKDAIEFLRGSTVDYTEGLQDTGFKITNPNVTMECGCGYSVH